MRIALTNDERKKYAMVGVHRRSNALERGRKGAHGFNRDNVGWQIDCEAAMAEYAAAKALGVTYSPVDDALDTHLGDIGRHLQIRSTQYNTGSLLVHDRDPEDDYFILVTGQDGVYDIRGWIQAKHAKQPAWWKVYKGRGAYWVGQQHLQPMGKLPTELLAS